MSNDTLTPPGLVAKYLDAAEINLEVGEPAMVAWLTLDCVDREGDVVIPSGVDFRSEYLDANPVVMAVHDYQRWPVGTCQWIKVKRNRGFNGLIAKTLFDVDDPDTKRLFGLVQRRIVRSVSIGFRPPQDFQPGEWGPPTREELAQRPEWAGARRVIRRCVLVEYSIVPIGMNPRALIIAVSQKGLELPTYLTHLLNTETTTMTGISDCLETCEEFDASENTKALSEGSGTSGGYVANAGSAAADEESPKESAMPPHLCLKAGDYVEWGQGRRGGCGRVMSIHRSGFVPGVEEDAEGTEAEPAAKVKVYAPHPETGKYRPTTKHVGRRCRELTKIEHPMAEMEEGPPLEHPDDRRRRRPVPATATKGAVLFAACPIDDGPWDAAAARAELARWASSDGSGDPSTIDWSKYEQGFAWCNGDRPEQLGAYKLPHHTVKDGRLHVNKRGVEAAYAALHGARGGLALPEADRAKAGAHLEKHYAQWNAVAGRDGKSLSLPPHRTLADVETDLIHKAATLFDPAAALARARVHVEDEAIGRV